ncbi:MAG: hypothetical protein WC142_05290 [Bacteroidales bacterium]|jgi:hypothetical protein|nr:hypothetical protein [Bacteroidales bacterium]MDD3330763.1 hypothetical protein [Bacteroidales bacterium]MDD3691657.1 hypothetical protein [Bacteroidales bacterium]MDD4045084.1 hypothetical protein [Bacteroidales bacterium]MDD4582120.1 hypothetical protein [Bacteroidales bacterium]
MSNYFTPLKKATLQKGKERKQPYQKTVVSLLNYSKSIEVKHSKLYGTLLFINN